MGAPTFGFTPLLVPHRGPESAHRFAEGEGLLMGDLLRGHGLPLLPVLMAMLVAVVVPVGLLGSLVCGGKDRFIGAMQRVKHLGCPKHSRLPGVC